MSNLVESQHAGVSSELSLRTARVVHVDEASLLVSFTGDDVAEIRSRVRGPLGDLEPLAVGDEVMVAGNEDRLILWGRIVPVGQEEHPRQRDTLVLEARDSLTLRVGDGSITIRADGKILIKGKDLVSHAQKMNRIKGGAVAIN
jgi:hypothetical protein